VLLSDEHSNCFRKSNGPEVLKMTNNPQPENSSVQAPAIGMRGEIQHKSGKFQRSGDRRPQGQ
jgi:hypothetical protein